MLALDQNAWCDLVIVLAGSVASVLALGPDMARMVVRHEAHAPEAVVRRARALQAWFAPDVEEGGAGGPTPVHPVERGSWVTRRPLLTVAIVCCAVAAVELWWIWRYRTFGTLDADEARYVASSILFRHGLGGAAHRKVFLWFGPIVPMLSAVAMVFGPMDPRTAMTVQPLFAVLLAVCTAGVANRLVGRTGAVVTGVAVMLIPATVAATQTYLLVLGASAVIMGAWWALLASEGGRGGSIWLVGPLLAAAPLVRGQTLVFLPALYVGAVLVCRRSRSGLRRLGISLGFATAGLAICFRIWTPAILSYLWGGSFDGGPSSPALERLAARWDGLYDGLGHPVLVGGVVAVVVGIACGRRRARRPGERELSITVLTFALGLVALLTSSNQGTGGFFDLPLLPFAVVAGVAVAMRCGRRTRKVAAAWTIGWLLVSTGWVLWIVPPGRGTASPLVGQYGTPLVIRANAADPRFNMRNPRQLSAAADEWWKFSLRLEAELDRIRVRDGRDPEAFDGGGVVNFNSYLIDTASALRNHPAVEFVTADLTATDRSRWPQLLEPSESTSRRVLLVPVVHRRPPQGPGGRRSRAAQRSVASSPQARAQRAFGQMAVDRGWSVEARLPLPLGDEMLVILDPRVGH